MTAPAQAAGQGDRSEVGADFQLIAKLLPQLPPETVRQLHAALGSRLALPGPSARRRERLGALLAFLSAHGRAPTASVYREWYRDRTARGEPAMALSTLEGYYGSYANAVDAAARLFVRGTAARVPERTPRPAPPGGWTETACLAAVERCAEHLGHWPSEPEFAALRRASTALLNTVGGEQLVLPWPKTIQRLFGSYGEMVAVAKRRRCDRDAETRTPGSREFADEAPRRRSMSRRRRSTRVVAPTPLSG